MEFDINLDGWDYNDRWALSAMVMRAARDQRWYCWVSPAITWSPETDWEAHFNWQSYNSSVFVNTRGAPALAHAIERVREEVLRRDLEPGRFEMTRDAFNAMRHRALVDLDRAEFTHAQDAWRLEHRKEVAA